MTSLTTTLLKAMPEEKFRPNVRPDGIEQSPDPRWRAWRLRQQRSEIRELLPELFPDINRQLREQDLEKIRQYSKGEVAPALFVPRKIQDLKGHKPIRLEFRPLRDVIREFDDERQRLHPRKIFRDDEDDAVPHTWITDMTQSLFARVWDFCADTFGRECFGGRVDDRNWTDFILRKLPTEFINCASSVARGDPARQPKPNDPHSYEHLFLAKNERIFLMVGTISKLLQLNVFDSLLFGAREDEAKELHLQDKTTLHIEDGYQRNFARTNVVRQYFTSGRDLQPPLFWDEVDRVTMGTLDLLLPMINFLGSMSPRTPWPTLSEVHQNLHNIVAEAAKLTNGIRVCRSICSIDYPLTGDLWALDHEHTSDVIYDASSQRTSELDAKAFSKRSEVKDWEIRRADAEGAARRRWPDREAAAWIRRWETSNPRPVDRSMRAAKVQIVLWPCITSYFPVRQNTANGGGYNEGEECRTIIKAQVVYYSGKGTDAGEQAEDFTLLQHIKQHGGLVNQRGISRFGHLVPRGRYESRLLTCLLVALLVLWLLLFSPLSQRPGSPANVEVIEAHQTAGTTTFKVTTTMIVGAAETSVQSDATSLPSSTSTTKRGFWPSFFGGKKPSASKPASPTSTRMPAPVPVVTEPETVAETIESSSKASSELTFTVSFKPAPEASPGSPSLTAAKVTESEWTDILKDGAEHSVSTSSLESTEVTARKVEMKSGKPSPSTKPKVVTKEGAFEHPVSVTKPESIKGPTSVSSPPPRPEKASESGSWLRCWLAAMDHRRLFDGSAGRSGGLSTLEPATEPAITTVDEETLVPLKESTKSSISTIKKEPVILPTEPIQPATAIIEEATVVLPEESATLIIEETTIILPEESATAIIEETTIKLSKESAASDLAAPSKAGGLTSLEESTEAPDSESAFLASLPLSRDEALLTDNLVSQTTTTEQPSTSSSSKTPVIQVVGPNQVTVTGPPPAAHRDAESSSSSPITSSDEWDLEYASIITYVSKWTNTRVKTYTDENGQLVTVSEEVPRSKESLRSIAPWHRRDLP